jgi:signal transduction histidine kinase
MNNPLLSGNIQEKIQWYIKAHGHSSIGGLNLLWTYFSYQHNPALADMIQKTIDEFQKFSESDDMYKHLARVKQDVGAIEHSIATIQLDNEKKQEMQQMLTGVYENIARIESIIKNPGYEEPFYLEKIIESAITELLKRHPQTLYGDLIGKRNNEPIRLSFSQRGEPVELVLCGYEMQLLFYNIISNAVDAIMEYSGTGDIKLFFDYMKEYVQVDIVNTGKKISADILQNIQSKKLFSTKGKHHGNGLRIINDISEKYHADVTVTSNDQQTTFSLKIPYHTH